MSAFIDTRVYRNFTNNYKNDTYFSLDLVLKYVLIIFDKAEFSLKRKIKHNFILSKYVKKLMSMKMELCKGNLL